MADQLDVVLAEYHRAVDERKMYVEIRFRLLAFVPTATAIGVSVAKDFESARLAVATIGLIATFSVVIYEMRNTQLHDLASHTVNMIRQWLGFDNELLPLRTDRHRLVGRIFVQHDVALALIYGVCIAAWTGFLLFSLSDFLMRNYAFIGGALDDDITHEVGRWLGVAVSASLGFLLARFVLGKNRMDAEHLKQLTRGFQEDPNVLAKVKGQRSP